MRVNSILILFLLFFSLESTAQTTISGVVTDDESKEPIPGVNVYIAGTTIGSSTNADGEFSFNTTLIGNQRLVATFIGYKSRSVNLLLGSKPRFEQNFQLKYEVQQLEEIEVRASNNEFLEQLDLFKTFFIGYDNFADRTVIQNAEVLDFDWNRRQNKITVTASKPLIIYNNALGYIYEIEIRQAYFNPEDYTGFYKIFPRVIEMEAPNRRSQRNWNRNRKQAYTGSRRHFLKSLSEDRVRRNKFNIWPKDETFVNYSDSIPHLKRWFPNNWELINAEFSVFTIESENVRIEYAPIRNNATGNQNFEPRISSIAIQGVPNVLVINNEGLLYNSARVATYGDWNDYRFSRFLPLDYTN